MMKHRRVEVAVISDLHLATHASKAKKVLKYLKSIETEVLVLNGDIIDSWRFTRNYFPKPHLKVVRQLIKMMEKGIKVHYISGNHDEFLRKMSNFKIGTLTISNQLVLELNGKKTWFLHGDIFDFTIHKVKWLAKFGAAMKGFLTIINKGINFILKLFGRKEIIIYKGLKSTLIKDKGDVSKFEKMIANAAIEKGMDTVICGHTHVPQHKTIRTDKGEVEYLNCGDWVESFTAAEYFEGDWSIFHFDEDIEGGIVYDEQDIPNKCELYQSLYEELAIASFQQVEVQ